MISPTPERPKNEVAIHHLETHFFSPEEIEEIKNADSDANLYFENSHLSERQQKILYSSRCHENGLSEPFFAYLRDNELSNNVLKASIGLTTPIPLTETEKEALHYFRLQFFAPNAIVHFSRSLLVSSDEQLPTVGDILEYYTQCVQYKLNDDSVLKLGSDETRAVVLGDIKHDFTDEGIFNQIGFNQTEEALHNFLQALFQLPENAADKDFVRDLVFKNDAFLEPLQALLKDMLQAIKSSGATQLTKFVAVYSNLSAMYPKAGWHYYQERLLDALIIAEKRILAYEKLRGVRERFESLNEIPEDQKKLALKILSEMKPRYVDYETITTIGMHAYHDNDNTLREYFIQFCQHHFLTQEVVTAFLNHQKPTELARTFYL